MEEKSFFLRYLGDSPKIRVLDFLIDNFALDFSLPQIAEGSRVAYTTLIDLLQELINQGTIMKTRKIGKSKLYKINLDSPIVKVLIAMDMKLSMAFIDNQKEIAV
ncbi:hypothetical protein HYW76_04365 [Candidatus Pacearchaeota archaeon]|nr:hypothetical protein [Candidatus Pacearchaeota archaeon]